MFLNKTAPYGEPSPAEYETPVLITCPDDRVVGKYLGTPYTIPFNTANRPQDYFDFDTGKLIFKRSGLYYFSLTVQLSQETGVGAPLSVVTSYIAIGAIRYGYGGVSLHPRLDTTPDLNTAINYGVYLDIEVGASLGCYLSNFTTSGTIKVNKLNTFPRTILTVQFIS